jgi:hypothetical protein
MIDPAGAVTVTGIVIVTKGLSCVEGGIGLVFVQVIVPGPTRGIVGKEHPQPT